MNDALIMKPQNQVGIIGYGTYIPMYRLPNTEVARVWKGAGGGPIKEKAVAGLDEDTVTISIEASRNALARAGIDPSELRAVWVGSESPPYAVKPASTLVAEAIVATPHLLAADYEFACKAGTEALQSAMGLVGSGMVKYALAIGADTAQSRPGDALEYTAASGGSAFIIGPAALSLATCVASYSYSTDTPDFWRRAHQHYPQHGGRFTGEPAYFHHIQASASTLMAALELKSEDFSYAIFHQPNTKFPLRVGQRLGFTHKQMEPGILSGVIGNTYAGASMTGLSAVLDIAEPGDRILLASFGSGAGSDTFVWEVTDKLTDRRDLAPSVKAYIRRRKEIDYALYTRYRGTLRTH